MKTYCVKFKKLLDEPLTNCSRCSELKCALNQDKNQKKIGGGTEQ